MATSLDGLNYSGFVPRLVHVTSALDYFNQGAQTAQGLIDQQYQAQLRAENLKQQQQRDQLNELLGPIQVQSAQQGLAQSQALDPLRVQQAQLGLKQNQAEYDIYQRNNAPLPYLGPGSTAGISSTPIGGAPATNPTTVSNVTPGDDGSFSTLGTVFAGPHDRAAYDRAKAGGATELQALAVGDNGIGAGGANTSDPTKHYVALSPSFMKANHLGLGDSLMVSANGKTTDAIVGDKLPDNSKNGAGIDFSPGTSSALGVDPDNYKGPVSFRIGGAPNPTSAASAVLTQPMASIGDGSPIAFPVIGASPAPASGIAAPVPNATLIPRLKKVVPGYLDPKTGIATPENDRLRVPPGATFGNVEVSAPNPNQSKADLVLIKSAPKGFDGDTTLDANGELSDEQRQAIRAAQKEVSDHKGTAIPSKTRDAARQMGVSIEGKSFDEVTQALQDKQIQDGLIPPELRVVAERIQSQIYQHPILKDYPKIREAKEAFDAGYQNQDTGGFGDMALVEGMQRMLNPGMGVRAQTMTQMLKGAGLAQYLSPTFIAEHIAQGEKFSPEVRARMKKLADDIFNRAQANAGPALTGMKRQAKSYGLPNPDAFVDNVLQIAPVLDPSGQPDDAPAAQVATPPAEQVPVGKIAVQGGVRYQKQADGSWKQL